MNNINNKKWWEPEYGFFGEFYLEGDNSKEGYLEKRQNLEERTRTEVVGVMNVLQIKGGEKILDCPCGYGRHSVMLANKWFDVVWSDINPIHLNKAIQQKGWQVKLQFHQENMLELKYNEEFDAVINMFYSFGFFDTDEENETVLMNFYKSLKYGGKFLMHTDVNIPRIENGKYKEDETRNLENGSQLRIIDKYNEETKRIDGYNKSLEMYLRNVSKWKYATKYAKEHDMEFKIITEKHLF